MITRQQNGLVCFAFCSTPARSCSEELFHHSATLAVNATAASTVATSPVDTSGGRPPVTDKEDAGVRKGVSGSLEDTDAEGVDKRACPKRSTTPSHSDFLPVPTAMATASTETINTGRRRGRSLSEKDDQKEEASWLDTSLPAT